MKIPVHNPDSVKSDHMLLSKLKIFNDPIRFLNFLIFFFIITSLFLRFILNFISAVNLDEFHYLSYVYQFSNNTLKEYLGSFHSFIFLNFLPKTGHEISVIIFFRFLLFSLFICNCYFTFLLAKVIMNKTAALFSVLCYLSFSYVFINACSFRYDSICSFLFLLSLVCLVYNKFSRIGTILSAIMIALSFMFTIKVYLHLFLISLFFLVMILHCDNRKYYILNSILFVIVLFFSFFILNFFFGHYAFNDPFLIFDSLLPESSNAFKTQFQAIISSSIKYFLFSIQRDTLIWFLIITGYLLFLRILFKKKIYSCFNYITFIVLLIFPLIYRNSFPYFYIFIASPPIIFAGYLPYIVTNNIPDKNYNKNIFFVIIISFFLILNVCFNFSSNYKIHNKHQSIAIESVHKMYSEPIAYIDGFSMISSFPQVSFFMSSWGMESYLSNNQPIFRNIIIEKKPKLLLANTEVIDLSLDYKNAKSVRGQSLLITDWLCLKANFINHWGIIYVPGKEFSFMNNGEQFDFEILIPSQYTIEATKPVIIDDIYYNPYDTIQLEFGFHKIKSNYSGNVILRIGNKLYRPQQTPVLLKDLYSRFG